MAENSAITGKVVFAGDLVKVQQGTKYCTITYYDFIENENIVQKHRAFRSFELFSSTDENFKCWNINSDNYNNGYEFDTGLSTDVSAYAHAYSALSVTYYRMSNITDTVNNCIEYPNETYFDAENDLVKLFRTYANITVDDYELQDYDKHRFLGWKKNGVGEMIQPGDTFDINTDIDLFAQWIRQYTLTLNSSVGGQIPQLVPETTANTFDVGTNILLQARPNDHYHLTQWKVTRTIEADDGSIFDETEIIKPFTYTPFRIKQPDDNDLSLCMNNDTAVTSTYAIDTHNLSVKINIPGAGYIEFKPNIITEPYKVTNITSLTSTNIDYNQKFSLNIRLSSNNYKFLYWRGDIAVDKANNSYIEKQISSNIALTAVFDELKRYVIANQIDNSFGGIIEYSASEGIDTPGIYREGEKAVITISAANQFYIDSFKVDGELQELTSINTNKYTFTNINKNHTIYVKFDTFMVDDEYEPLVDNTGTVLSCEK